ncbi:mechanosensitive ion channel domain-containing protein [uncultured Cohaesibacter sp.]|uniref:mechanosensitive ion channel domain-containing protein n=1 Tax=uncultured Cohaesibacter sp. TaxID=1002546 RepID=UPI0029C6BDF5|nr:mechanosensitive ion channel domain-containing protein [uncultured Cohaesibacter sp.]
MNSCKFPHWPGYLASLLVLSTTLLWLSSALASEPAAVADTSAFTSGTLSLLNFFIENATLAGDRLIVLPTAIGELPSDVSLFIDRLSANGFSLQPTLLQAAIWLSIGALVEHLFRRVANQFRIGSKASHFGTILIRSILDLAGILIFAIIGGWSLLMSTKSDPVAQTIIFIYLTALLSTRLIAMLLRIPLAPYVPELRVVDLDDNKAHYLYRDIVSIAALAFFFTASLLLLKNGGLREGALLIFALSSRALVAIMVIAACFRNKTSIASILGKDPTGRLRSAAWRSFATVWHWFAIIYVSMSWFVTTILLLLGHPEAGLDAIFTIIVLMGLIVVCLVIDDWAAHADNRDRDRLIEAPDSQPPSAFGTQNSFPQFFSTLGQTVATLVAIFIIIRLWSGPWNGFYDPRATRFALALVQFIATLMIAYVLWHLVVISSNRILLRAASPRDEASGLKAVQRDRIATLLPFIRSVMLVTIATIATLIGLSSIGVNVVPLLAGAGVIGLAFGMGSQALVKDIVSGVFFLIDDAFRVGEMIDVGVVKGTVERAGVRSLQIRHYLGALHTVPFGEIHTIANHSRQWIAAELEFRIPIDTDMDLIKESFSALSDRLLSDAEHGQRFLAPINYCGVVKIEENTMIIRLIYECLPGEQYTLRHVVQDNVRKMLRSIGVPFAVREFRMLGSPDGK